jgi:ABC-type lipoprotein export system ATPase subunit
MRPWKLDVLSDQSTSLRHKKSAEEDMLLGLGLPLRLLKEILQRLHLLGPLRLTISLNNRLRFDSRVGIWGAVQFVWLNFRRNFLIHGVTSFLMLFTITAWGWIVGAWLEGRSITQLPGVLTGGPLWPSFFLLVVEALGGGILILNELDMRACFLSQTAARLIDTSLSSDDEQSFDRVRSRDLFIVSDLLSSGISLVSGPLICIIGMILVYMGFGEDAIAAAIAIGLAAVLSAGLARKGARVSQLLIAAGNARLALVSQWVQSGRWLLSWQSENKALAALEQVTRREIGLLNIDSLIRSTETYINTFGVALPLIGGLLAAWLSGHPMQGMVSLAWAGLPFVGLVMSLSRYYSDSVQMSVLLDSLRAGTPMAKEAVSNISASVAAIVLSADWDIYDGSLSANIDPGGCHPEIMRALLVRLRLCEEFLDVGPEIWLLGGGENVSAGQKLRILIARAFLQAITERKRVIVHDPLASLDADSIRRVLSVARRYSIDVDWNSEALVRIDSIRVALPKEIKSIRGIDEARAKNEQRADELKHKCVIDDTQSSKVWKTILVRSPPAALLYLLPAVGVAMLARMVKGGEYLTVGAFAPSFFLVTLLAFTLAVGTSFLIECSLRLQAGYQHATLLRRVMGFSAEDFLQRLSRDYSNVVGRLAYYINDMDWIFAGILVSFGALISGFGFYGLGIAGIFTLICGTIWNCLVPRVVNSRRKIPIGINIFLAQTENLKRLAGMPLRIAIRLKHGYVGSGLGALWETQAASLASKAALCYYIRLTSVATLFLVCAIGPMVATESKLIFTIAALLTVIGSSSVFVQALSGFAAQSNSYARLEACGADDVAEASVKVVHEAVEVMVTRRSERSHFRWQRGACYTLLGTSGSGKSRYLRSLATATSTVDSIQQAKYNILYFPKEAPDYLGELNIDWWAALLDIVTNALSNSALIIILDEALSTLPVVEARQALEALNSLLGETRSTVILVDHRFIWGQTVQMAALEYE